MVIFWTNLTYFWSLNYHSVNAHWQIMGYIFSSNCQLSLPKLVNVLFIVYFSDWKLYYVLFNLLLAVKWMIFNLNNIMCMQYLYLITFSSNGLFKLFSKMKQYKNSKVLFTFTKKTIQCYIDNTYWHTIHKCLIILRSLYSAVQYW